MNARRPFETELTGAVTHFWMTRQSQAARQQDSGRRDQGSRGEVTGGKQMDEFVRIVREVIIRCGIAESCIHTSSQLEIPGYFRPEKKWDLLVIYRSTLVAAVEFKSQIGPSFGNNFNNRTEEAIGTAHDIWTAYREGAFCRTCRPWLGYLMMLEDCPRSTSPVAVKQPHFSVFPEFLNSSYARRYLLLLNKLLRERLYDGACLIMSNRTSGLSGEYSYPDSSLSFQCFAISLQAHITAHVNMHDDEA